MTRFQRAVREALAIALVGATLGFAYTALQGRGVFAPDGPQTSVSVSASPTMVQLPEALRLFELNQALFIDARHTFEYSRGHIPGAVSLPIGEFDTATDLLASLPKDKVLITYCDGAECNSSINLAAKLHETGFSGVRIFFGGWNEWTGQDLPIEEGTK